MKQDIYDAAWRDLSLHIGAGRLAPEGNRVLTLEYHHEAGIRWADSKADSREIWCHPEALCDWLAPQLPIHHFSDYPEDLYPLLTQLVLEKLSAFLECALFSPGTLTTGTLPAGWQVTLTLRDGERRLPLILVGWSWPQVCQLTMGWLPFASTKDSLPLSLPLCLGYCELTLSKLLALQAGDGIVLHAANITAGELWLWLEKKRLTMIQNEDGDLQVKDVMEVADSNLGLADRMAVPLSLIAEVGQVALSVAELMTLAPGAVLEGKASLSGGIRLIVNGCCIGYGSLLMLGDKWVVRVDTLINNRIALPEPAKPEENVLDDTLHDQGEGQYGMAD